MLRKPTRPGGRTASWRDGSTTSRSVVLPSGREAQVPPKHENMPCDSSGVLGRESGAASPLADTLALCATGVSGPYKKQKFVMPPQHWIGSRSKLQMGTLR